MFTLCKHNLILLINRALFFVVVVVVFNLIFLLFLFLFISHYFKNCPWTRSIKVVHGPLGHVLSSPIANVIRHP